VQKGIALLLLAFPAIGCVCWLLYVFRGEALNPGAAPRCIGPAGLALGQFQRPRGITTFPDGSFVVVDRAARVQTFSADGKPQRLWRMREAAFGNPKGLCALPDGNLLVCDTHYGRVLVMSPEGEILKQWGKPGLGPGEFTFPLSAAADAKRGVAYIVEYGYQNHRVQKFSLDGKFLKMWGTFGSEPGQFQRPSGVALDPDGNVYVADAANHRIQKFNSEGAFLSAFGQMGQAPGQLRYPYDIACGPDRLLYAVEYDNHRVSVFDCDGHFLRTVGGCGSGPGEFAFPWSLTVDARGRLLVSDTGNNRVQIFFDGGKDLKNCNGAKHDGDPRNLQSSIANRQSSMGLPL
jgi:DNA-binding beta-propeller fold protein YncE